MIQEIIQKKYIQSKNTLIYIDYYNNSLLPIPNTSYSDALLPRKESIIYFISFLRFPHSTQKKNQITTDSLSDKPNSVSSFSMSVKRNLS